MSFAAKQRELLLIALHGSGESSDVGARLLQRLAAGVELKGINAGRQKMGARFRTH